MAEAAAKSAALAAFSNQDMLSHNSCSWVQVEQGRPGGGGGGGVKKNRITATTKPIVAPARTRRAPISSPPMQMRTTPPFRPPS